MARHVHLKMSAEAYDELDRLASEQKVPLNELCLRLLMTHATVKRPDLSSVPRVTQIGRPRTKVAAAG